MKACQELVRVIEAGEWNDRASTVQALYELIKHVESIEQRVQRCEDAVGIDRQNLEEVDGSLRQVWSDLDNRVRRIERQLEVADSDHKVRTLDG